MPKRSELVRWALPFGVSLSYAGLLQIVRSRLLLLLLSWSRIVLDLDSCVCIITSCWHGGHVTSEWATRWRFLLKRLHWSVRRSSPLTLMRQPSFGDGQVLAVFAVKLLIDHFSSDIFFALTNAETCVMLLIFKAAVILPTWNLTWEQLSSPKLKPSWLGHVTWLVSQSRQLNRPDPRCSHPDPAWWLRDRRLHSSLAVCRGHKDSSVVLSLTHSLTHTHTDRHTHTQIHMETDCSIGDIFDLVPSGEGRILITAGSKATWLDFWSFWRQKKKKRQPQNHQTDRGGWRDRKDNLGLFSLRLKGNSLSSHSLLTRFLHSLPSLIQSSSLDVLVLIN